jgi:NAD(P)-dependent dehydrogenase (short-subunit alcohol dehydrogenase family)
VGRLDARVAIVTGAGRGLGRAHALHLAAQGAAVVVNDLGVAPDGAAGISPAAEVVEEIERAGGRAVASSHDVADWNEAGALVETALRAFGKLDILVNNAGILRDRTLARMTEAEWDSVVRVHLKGHAAPTHHALAYWRERSKAGAPVAASVVHTSSIAAFAGNFGQANYAAAKLAVLALSRVVDLEGASHGVRSNVVAPSARTRLVALMRGGEALDPPEQSGAFDEFDAANVAPLVGWLAEAACPATSQVFYIYGRRLFILGLPSIVHRLETPGRWTPEALDEQVPGCLVEPPTLGEFLPM